MKNQAFALGLLVLAGCATQYVAPTSGKTATVTFTASGLPEGSWALVQNFASEDCRPSPNGTRLATFTTTKIQGKGDPHAGARRVMPADQPAVITFVYQQGVIGYTRSETCEVTQTFVPEAGKSYRLSFRHTGYRCVVTVEDDRFGGAVPVLSARQVTPACYNKING